ncbi:MAG: type II toxin-antitoxin system VapC family toxin [Parvularculaceae bacterium]
MIVVDASAVVEWLLRRPAGETVNTRFTQSRGMIYAPHIIDLEIAHALRRYVVSGALTVARAEEALTDFGIFPLRRFGHAFLMRRVWMLRNNLTAYDAAYVALAEMLMAPLVTCDSGISSASGHFATVELI